MNSRMDKNHYYKLLGYVRLLENAEPNGRHIHAVKNKICALNSYIDLDKELPKEREEDIKELIRKIYC